MNDDFDEEQDSSQVPNEVANRGLELTARQRDIHGNLKDIGEEIAAFYLDGLKILHDGNLQTAASLLGHLAKEIDSGLKDLLPPKEDANKISQMLAENDFGFAPPRILASLNLNIDDLQSHTPLTNQDKARIENRLKERGLCRSEYIASILTSLNLDIDNLPSQRIANRVDIAIRWIDVSTRFNDFDHKHGVGKSPQALEKFLPLWETFEDVLANLVGSYLNFSSHVIDQILKHKVPTKDVKNSLRNMVKLDPLEAGPGYRYFFEQLPHRGWLEPLSNIGYFNPKYNPPPQEIPDEPGYYRTPVWYALEYAVKVANQTKNRRSNQIVNTLVKIIDAIIDYTNDNGERIDNYRTDWQIIRIIGTLPVEKIESRHITFMRTVLNSRSENRLASQEIARTILPKFIRDGKKDLTLGLLQVILDAKIINRKVITIMDEYWLREAFKSHCETIAKLCGVNASKIALAQIRKLITQDARSFDRILIVAREPSNASYKNYPELLVDFINTIFQFTSADVVKENVTVLIQEAIPLDPNIQSLRGLRAIFGLIALKAITYHYDSLKSLLWNWPNNPFGEFELRPELRRLIRMRCQYFDSGELDQILHWIKSYQYHYEKDDKKRIKIEAKLKREWLSMLLKTGNEKVIAAYQKYDRLYAGNTENSGIMPKSGAIGPVRPLTISELSKMSNAEIADYLNHYKEQESSGLPVLTGRGLADTLSECVAANPQRFTDNLLPFQSVRNLYQSSLLRGFLNAWSDKKTFDWAALLGFIRHILASEHFWAEQYEDGFNYRNWVLSTAADLISEGTKDDTHAFNTQLLPLAEDILLILVDKAQQSVSTLDNLPTDVLNSDRGRVFSAMVDYALRFARTSESEYTDCRWPYAIRADFTKRLDRSVEPSLEFSYTLGFHLPYLSYLDEEWVYLNINRIFPQRNEDHWQAAFSGYLLHPGVREEFYSLLKAHGHYQKALSTRFADSEVLNKLVNHICTGWIEDSETLDNKASLIYQLIHSGNPNLLSAMVYFFSRRADNLSDKVKAKVMPAWRALFEVLSQHSDEAKYQAVLSPLSQWIGLIDEIDDEVLAWIKVSINYLDKVPGYALTLSKVIEALQKHVLITPEKVGEIYLEIPESELWVLGQTQKGEVEETVRTLYKKGHNATAEAICERFAKAGVLFLRSVREEHQN